MSKKVKDKNKENVDLTKAEKVEHKAIIKELQDESKIPDSLLSQIGEFSPAGFALFSLDEKGNVLTNIKFENDSAVVTLTWHILQWVQAQNYVNEEMFKRGFFGNMQENGEDFQNH